MEEVRVLAFTPTYGAGPRPETVASVGALEWEGRLDSLVSWANPYPEGDMRNVAAQLALGRDEALEGGYDGLLVVEHDMLVPADALERLWECEAPVAYGAYLFRHGSEVLNLMERYGPRARNVGESLSLKPRLLERARRRGRIPVSGMGFGCTLIRRGVLERIPFREMADRMGSADMAFAQDCVGARVEQMGCLDVACGHWDGARWLWPAECERSAG